MGLHTQHKARCTVYFRYLIFIFASFRNVSLPSLLNSLSNTNLMMCSREIDSTKSENFNYRLSLVFSPSSGALSNQGSDKEAVTPSPSPSKADLRCGPYTSWCGISPLT